MSDSVDLHADWGGDLDVDSSGDLLVVDGDVATQQSIVRRLFTASGGYGWHVGYGAGVGAFVGQVLNEGAVVAVIRSQMMLEDSVSQDPPPVVTASAIDGGVLVTIAYVDAGTGESVNFSLPVVP